jgi:acetyl-CoA acetyltransferase family protein
VAQPMEAANVARVIALRAGIPEHVPAMTVHRNCASGCEALTQAYERMAAGRGSIFIVGGTESMSQIPLLFPHSAAGKFLALNKAKSFGGKVRALASFGPSDFRPSSGLLLGLTDPVCGLNMGQTAEVLAREFAISRQEQDAFALESHRRAVAASEKLSEEIAPFYLSPGGPVSRDNGPRGNQTLEALARLKPIFEPKTGTVTAGNSSQITDGAVALLAMSESKAGELGFSPLGYLAGYSYAGCDPSRMGLGPVFALDKLQAQSGLSLADADLIEINEAFAAQVLAVLKALESEKFARKILRRPEPLGVVSREKLNVNGGAIALGHPVGATGARLILGSLLELRRRKAKRALISLCVGGGQGAALWLEAL